MRSVAVESHLGQSKNSKRGPHISSFKKKVFWVQKVSNFGLYYPKPKLGQSTRSQAHKHNEKAGKTSPIRKGNNRPVLSKNTVLRRTSKIHN